MYFFFLVSDVRVIERIPPAPIELKKEINCYEVLFFIKPPVLSRYKCTLVPDTAHGMSDICRGRSSLKHCPICYIHYLLAECALVQLEVFATFCVTRMMCAMNLSSSADRERVEQFAFNSITRPLTNTAKPKSGNRQRKLRKWQYVG